MANVIYCLLVQQMQFQLCISINIFSLKAWTHQKVAQQNLVVTLCPLTGLIVASKLMTNTLACREHACTSQS